ncbi:MAG: hypothetical protein IIW60_02120 [Alistipes sp.]|nr:hypothetical protein [Alistipes sp.]
MGERRVAERGRLIRYAAFHCYGSAKYVNILCSRLNRSVTTSLRSS